MLHNLAQFSRAKVDLFIYLADQQFKNKKFFSFLSYFLSEEDILLKITH